MKYDVINRGDEYVITFLIITCNMYVIRYVMISRVAPHY
jgi:hypothetical protein